MKTDEIRKYFLDFFASKGHKVFPSDSLVPSDDKTVLFTSAGMNQFKPYFLGIKKDISCAVSAQKCLRTDDLIKVGRTSFHHTFFEMLGNFSFGDYFKEEAISWGWEFIKDVVGLAEDKIWVSVYEDDEESFKIWTKKIGFPEDKIARLGAGKNFWPANAITAGPNGPCGPCSEIFYDLGKEVGCGRIECNPGCDCGRFVEIWNLVFTQFNRTEKDGKGVLEPLPSKNIDTGMGLERIASVIQDVNTNFEIDIFKPIIDEIVSLIDKKGDLTFHINAIADHIRAVVFAIADGVFPSNEERGYVIRKIIRKAFWHGYKLGLDDTFLYKIVPVVVSVMKPAYPELEMRRENISRIVKAEEERFQNTLDTGLVKLNDLIKVEKGKNQNILPGEKVFQLYDTHGFPYELTAEIAHDAGFKIDSEGFKKALDNQRQRSKGKSNLANSVFIVKDKELLEDLPETEFLGYDLLKLESKVVGIFNFDLTQKLPMAKSGQDAVIVVEKSPFYAESGGQIADRGEISNNSFKAELYNTRIKDLRILHFVKVNKGSVRINDQVKLEVDVKKRLDTARNHTATHLLQAALRKILGEHVEQSGSFVGPDKLRFDFTHFKALTKDEISWIEKLVNSYVMENHKLNIVFLPFKQAKEEGALAFFTEKYRDEVRVVEISSISKELCGGTHVDYTGQIGLFKIISETSSSSGIRRIEAVTGNGALEYIEKEQELLSTVLEILKTDRSKAVEILENLFKTARLAGKRSREVDEKEIEKCVQELIAEAIKIRNVTFITGSLGEDKNKEFMARLLDRIKIKSGTNTAIVLYSIINDKPEFLIGLTDDLVKKGLNARDIVKVVSGFIKGGGGGRADFAQAGGKDASGMSKVIKKIREELEVKLK